MYMYSTMSQKQCAWFWNQYIDIFPLIAKKYLSKLKSQFNDWNALVFDVKLPKKNPQSVVLTTEILVEMGGNRQYISN